jgi:arylsulfatase A-like enzyme
VAHTLRIPADAAYRRTEISGTSIEATVFAPSVTTNASSVVENLPPGVLIANFAFADTGAADFEAGKTRRRSTGRGGELGEDSRLRRPAEVLGRARISLAERDSWFSLLEPFVGSCIASLSKEVPAWEECRIEIPRAVRSADIHVSVVANDDVAVALSEIRVVAEASSKPPVFIVLFDAVRADRFRPFTEIVPIGENLKSLADDGVTFTNLRSSSSWTRPAVGSLLTGLRSERHRVHGRLDVLGEEFRTLGEILRERGYYTRAWSTNPNILPMWGFSQGFDEFTDAGSQNWARAKTNADALFDAVDRRIYEAVKLPVAYYVHLMDAHVPYLPSEQARSAIAGMPAIERTFPRPDEVETLVSEYGDYRSYLGEMLELDLELGKFVDTLRELGVYEKALILVVSDHGEEFLDHGGVLHGRTLFEEVLRVPAIVKLPNSRGGGTVVSAPVSIEDLFPTVLGGLGAPAPDGSGIDGVDLLGSAGTEPAAGQARPHYASLRLDGRRLDSIIDGSWKLIVDRVNRGTMLFDLSTDPGEHDDLSGAKPEKLQALTTLLDAERAQASAGWHFLFCGTDTAFTFDLEIEGRDVRPISFDLEKKDRVILESSQAEPAVKVSMSLDPYRRQRSDFANMRELDVDDRDRLYFPVDAEEGEAPKAPFVVRHPRGVPFRYALGEGKSVAAARQIELAESMPRAVVKGGALIECPPTGDERRHGHMWGTRNVGGPFVRIWYVPPTVRRAQGELPPDVVERLRTLGYLQ